MVVIAEPRHAPELSHASGAVHAFESSHIVPVGARVWSQIAMPNAQRIRPTRHMLVAAQLAPSTHGTHVPDALQIPPGHGVSTGAVPPPTHTGAPELHAIVPRAHGPPAIGTHDAPALHGTHVPDGLHTLAGPHGVPAGAGPVAVHVAVPPAQEICPLRHGSLGAHAAPLVHVMHAPIPLQTIPAPQLAPAETNPVATHIGAPETQRRSPF